MKPSYNQNFISQPWRKEMFEWLLGLDWLTVKTARKELFMSNTPRTYFYGNRDYEYQSQSFDLVVSKILMWLNISCGTTNQYNVCFLNRYDDQHQALGWHADDSPNVDPDHPIAVVSFGAEREIWWKPVGFKGEVPKENRQLLHNGSLFIMPPRFQQNFMHKIPKHSRECGTRISLTFRKYI